VPDPGQLPGLPDPQRVPNPCSGGFDACNPLAPNGPECDDVDRDYGVGGTHADCKYSCPQLSELAIRVEAEDRDATVYGNTECGGAEAKCDLPAYVCTGVSIGPALRDDQDKICNGFSREKVDSAVYVACVAVNPESMQNPDEVLCAIVHCRLSAGTQNAFQTCAQAPGVSENLDLLTFALTGLETRTILSFVASHQTVDGLFAIRYEAASVESPATCVTQAIVHP
jgi:hypothetical protein